MRIIGIPSAGVRIKFHNSAASTVSAATNAFSVTVADFYNAGKLDVLQPYQAVISTDLVG